MKYLMEKAQKIVERDEPQDPFKGKYFNSWDEAAQHVYTAYKAFGQREALQPVQKEVKELHDNIRSFDDPGTPFPDEGDFKVIKGELENTLKYLSKYEDNLTDEEKNGYRALMGVYGFLYDLSGDVIDNPYEG